MINAILLTAEIANDAEVVSEVTEATKTIFGYPMETVLKFGILIVIVVAICVWFIFRPSDEKKKIAQDYLTSMATQVMEIAFANISIDLTQDIMVDAIKFDYKTFEEKVLEAIKKDSWDFVKTSIKYAVDNGKLDPLASRLITEESVNALVKLIVGRPDMKEAFKDAYNHLANTIVKDMQDEAEKAKQLAEWAEKQPSEPGDPVSTETVNVLAADKTKVDDSDTIEIIEKSETTDVLIDPSIDPDTIDDDNDPNTVG